MPQRVSLWDWPRLTRFYGIPPKDLARMPYALLEIYAEALIELSAEEAMEALTFADYPYLEKSSRERIRRAYMRTMGDAAEPEEKGIDIKTEHGKATAARFGIKVEPG